MFVNVQFMLSTLCMNCKKIDKHLGCKNCFVKYIIKKFIKFHLISPQQNRPKSAMYVSEQL